MSVILIYGSGTIRHFLKKRGCHGYMMAGNESEAIYLAYHLTGLQEKLCGWLAGQWESLADHLKAIVSAIQLECRLRRGEFVLACGAGPGMS